MQMRKAMGVMLLVGLVVQTAGGAAEDPARHVLKSNPGKEFYVYLPKSYQADKQYWLLVAIHGMGGTGKGAVGFAYAADELDCIVMGPTMEVTAPPALLAQMIQQLSQEHKLRPKILLTGSSNGSIVAHNVVSKYPLAVQACAVFCPFLGSPTMQDRMVPYLLICGTTDRAFDGTRRYAAEAEWKGYAVQHLWLEGVGHTVTKEGRTAALEFFKKAIAVAEPAAKGKKKKFPPPKASQGDATTREPGTQKQQP